MFSSVIFGFKLTPPAFFPNTKVWGLINMPVVILKYLITGIEIKKKVTQVGLPLKKFNFIGFF